MKRYDEVEEKLNQQFAFVRASQIFWMQDSVIDSDLPPPFNLVQLLHPKRGIVAWLVWLLVAPPVSFVLTLVFILIMTFVYWPLIFFRDAGRLIAERLCKKRATSTKGVADFQDVDLRKLQAYYSDQDKQTEKRVKLLRGMTKKHLKMAVAAVDPKLTSHALHALSDNELREALDAFKLDSEGPKDQLVERIEDLLEQWRAILSEGVGKTVESKVEKEAIVKLAKALHRVNIDVEHADLRAAEAAEFKAEERKKAAVETWLEKKNAAKFAHMRSPDLKEELKQRILQRQISAEMKAEELQTLETTSSKTNLLWKMKRAIEREQEERERKEKDEIITFQKNKALEKARNQLSSTELTDDAAYAEMDLTEAQKQDATTKAMKKYNHEWKAKTKKQKMFDGLSKAELRRVLDASELDTKGTKDELVDRIDKARLDVEEVLQEHKNRLVLPLYCWVALFVGFFHWIFIVLSTTATFFGYYWRVTRKAWNKLRVWAASRTPCLQCLDRRDKLRRRQAEQKMEESFDNLRLLSQNMTRCMDFISSRNEQNLEPDWSNRQGSGVLDRLVGEAFKTEAEREAEAVAEAKRTACEGVELAKARRANAKRIEGLWKVSAVGDGTRTGKSLKELEQLELEHEKEQLRCVSALKPAQMLSTDYLVFEQGCVRDV